MISRSLAIVAALCVLPHVHAQEIQQLSRSDKKAAIERIDSLLIDNYVFEDVARRCADHLNRRFAAGTFDSASDLQEFSRELTKELQSISHDKHMRVSVPPQPPDRANAPDPLRDDLRMRRSMAEHNFGVARAEVLEGNIGLLDIRSFPPTELSRGTVTAALKVLENVDALIVDLRKNSGGNPDLIRYYCSYFFPAKTHLNSLYWRQGNRTEEFWTLDSVDGKRRQDLPIFILTSSRTFSGGEEFAYDFKTRKRATLVGETTGGGANPGGFFRINSWLGIFIPTGRAINPVTKTNWEGTGVEPDIKVAADDALNTCLPLAREKAKQHEGMEKQRTDHGLEEIREALDEGEKLIGSGRDGEGERRISSALESAVTAGLVSEISVNDLGYSYLQSEKTAMAIAVLSFNVKQYPRSPNVYDSLGEALMKAGRIEESIRNYRKSIELDPTNENAKEMIKKMSGGMKK
jgi:tetratricopeptide (TPR) repeat protein